MVKKLLVIARSQLLRARRFLSFAHGRLPGHCGGEGIRENSSSRFVINGHAFRFVGANVAVMYRDEDREQMPETIGRAAQQEFA